MTVNAGPEEVGPERIAAAVARTGMRAEPWRDEAVGDEGLGFWTLWRRTLLTVGSGVAVGAGVAPTSPAVGASVRASRP